MTIPKFEFDKPISAGQAIELTISILRSVGVDERQVALLSLRQYAKLDPDHRDVYEDGSEVLECQTYFQAQQIVDRELAASATTLTATQVGKMLTERYPDIIHPPSAQRINQALEELKFHSRHGKKIWQLTELGQQYGRLISVTDEQDRTRLQVRWLPTVIKRLAPLFSVSC